MIKTVRSLVKRMLPAPVFHGVRDLPYLVLDLLGLINNEQLHFVSAGTTTKPFNAARINLGGLVNALTQLHVYGAGICQ